VCLLARGQEEAWRWHAQLGHLNFQAIKKMVNQDRVQGLPWIDHVDQLCDECLTGKHRRMPFPEEAEYHTKKGLEVIHGDLCGPINPTTPGGKRVFLLLIDNYDMFMWIVLL
jgi:hypothetical protein